MLPEILQRLTLRHVIGVLLKITEPELAVLPVDIPKTFHAAKVHSRRILSNDIVLAETLWLTACNHVRSYEIEKSGVVAVHVVAGCPGGQSRKNVLAHGGVCVLIHHVNTN
jgi:hypothetical protein